MNKPSKPNLPTGGQPPCDTSELAASARGGAPTSQLLADEPSAAAVLAMVRTAARGHWQALYRKPSGNPEVRKEIARRAGWLGGRKAGT